MIRKEMPYRTLKLLFRLAVVLGFCAAVHYSLTACSQDMGVQSYRVPKTQPVLTQKQQIQEKDQQQKLVEQAGGLAWKTPAGWSVQGQSAGSMRVAGFTASSKSGQAKISVVKLQGDGGGVDANVNRWRGQIGLKPLGVGDIRKNTYRDKGELGRIKWYQLSNPEQPGKGILAAIIKTKQEVIFVKMTGADQVLKENKRVFLKFCRSIRRA